MKAQVVVPGQLQAPFDRLGFLSRPLILFGVVGVEVRVRLRVACMNKYYNLTITIRLSMDES